MQNQLAVTLKRTAETIFEKGGIIRKLENMGIKDMPYKTSIHGIVHRKASYFFMEFNIPPAKIEDLLEEYARDVDIIRRRIYKKQPEDDFECTLHEEMQPPPYRKNVQELMKSVKTSDKKFNYNTGLDYYPFQK